MSKYTTEVRFICEMYAGVTELDGNSVEDIIDKSVSKVFDFDFPMFDESYRSVLEKKILRRYYTREIGLETVGLWKHFLCMRLNEIMPYYNQMYKSETLEFNPFYDFDYQMDSNRDVEHNEEGSSNNTSVSSGSSLRTDDLKHTESSDTGDAYSDTPQNGLADVDNLQYLTNYRKIKDNSNSAETGTQKIDNSTNGSIDGNSKRKIDSTDKYIEHVKGKRNGITYSKMLMEYRKSFLNIDRMIINDLSDLFMNLW